jgi:glucokinase
VILVGDIGGTNTRLALYGPKGKKPLAEIVRPSREHRTLEEIARPFLREHGSRVRGAVLGVAGLVQDGAAKITNLPWRLDERALARALGVPWVVLQNDLVVHARGCLHVPKRALAQLTPKLPVRKHKNLIVIAAGTGLGEARLIWTGDRYLALATEGGHGDFAPRSPLEIELWHFLAARYPDHVSYERVVSGAGLGALFDFFASRAPREPRSVSKRLADGDRNAAIAELGLARAYRPAARAVDLFAEIYGAETGNMVMRELALGGVFVTGSIARKIVVGRRDLFLAAMRQKGRFSALLTEVPVAVVTDPLVGVHGALAIAQERR